MSDWRAALAPFLIAPLRAALDALDADAVATATELRLRAGGIPQLCMNGKMHQLPLDALPPADIRAMAGAMLGHAAHARQEELRQGFVTLPGGFRAGFAGRAVVKEGRLHALQDIASLAVRIARAVPGAADALLPHLIHDDRPLSALIISPPGLGKTTLLRDAARQLSGRGLAVSVVDERSEIAACADGVPTLDVGANTDVLDGCPKAEGMRLMLRAMAPQVLITDEIGRAEDVAAVAEALRCGVAVLASAHAGGYADLRQSPLLVQLLGAGGFQRVLLLAKLGQVGAVYSAEGDIIA
ncbi:MAG: stage III sporulation protein AA [Oscillospiraceae bacterium]|jgi:stage III sporulation protein AA|nr:stage III sporulation protein AA [Oscillospiraceae bacterium]